MQAAVPVAGALQRPRVLCDGVRRREESWDTRQQATNAAVDDLPRHSQEQQNSSCMVLASSLLSERQRQRLKKLCRLLRPPAKFHKKFAMGDEPSARTTHVVVGADEEGTCTATLKYLMAISCGCWVVGFSWVEACESLLESGTGTSGAQVDELQHEVTDDANGPNGARRSRLARERGEPGVLAGLRFLIDQEHVGRKSAAKAEDLERLVILNHADLATQSPCIETMLNDHARGSSAPSQYRNVVIVRDVVDDQHPCARITGGSCWPALRTTTWLLETIRTLQVQQPVLLAAAK